MPITTTQTKADVDSFVQRYIDNKYKAIIYYLSYIGEKAVNEARANGNYKDQTNNLRSSIGFVISLDGNIVKWGDFKNAGTSLLGTGQEGIKSGKEFASSIATDIKDGFCLTIVAGREYAQYVMDKGYNVLQSSEQMAILEANKLVKKLNGK